MIRRILDFSVKHRWLVVLVCLAAAIFGVWSLGKLPIDAVPDITNNQVQINTTASALSPVEIERQVTFRIENALAGIPGLEYTRSLSRNGFSQVTAVFSDKTNIYFARQQINERLLEVRTTLPAGAEPRLGPISTGLGEVYVWAVRYSPERSAGTTGKAGWQPDGNYLTPEGQVLTDEFQQLAYLRTVQDWIIRPQLRTLAGIAGVDSIGGYVKQYHVRPDPTKLMSFGLSLGDLARAIEANNASRGAGYVERNGEAYVVRAGGRVESVSDIAAITIASRNGVPVRVGDVADVAIGGELRTGSASENGREIVVGTALMLIGSNSRTVAAAVDAKLLEINRSLPRGIEARPLLDRTQLVNATIGTVASNLAEGALLVILVLFLLLGNLRAALITALVIPITMLITTTGMVQAHISANLMSLGALDFGLIVDGAVIIAENSLRHLAREQQQLGRTLQLNERLIVVREAAAEMIEPTVFGQAIIMLVYVPMLTFTGVEGKMFEPMALTVLIALAAAFVLSLTVVPALIAICVTGLIREREPTAVRWLKRIYAPLLYRVVRHPMPAVWIAVALFVGALVLFSRLGQEFIPTLDERNMAMHAVRIPGASLTQSQSMQFEVERSVARLPEVAYVFSKTGTAEAATDPMPPNVSDTFIILKPHDRWPNPSMNKQTLIERLEEVVTQLPGNAYEFTQPIQMRFNELLAGVRGDLAVKVFGEEFEPMLRLAEQVAQILRAINGATDVRVEQSGGLPVMEIMIDKAEIARRGINLAAVQDIVGTAIGGRHVGVVFEGDRSFEIAVLLPEAQRNDIEALRNLPVQLSAAGSTSGVATVPLHQVATFRFGEGPNQVSRENGRRRVVVTANVRGRDIASVVAQARQRIETEVRLPAGYWITWGGQYENLAAARERLMYVVPACFMLIFLLLFGALHSVRDALLVFSAVPVALIGGVAALWLRGMPLSISAAVGFIALSGVAVLNGLVMLTAIRQRVEAGDAKINAIQNGALVRLRPVIMTALVASLGFVPMAMATGTGAEVQKPLATVVIGGLITATLLTLIILPALYSRFARSEIQQQALAGAIGSPAE